MKENICIYYRNGKNNINILPYCAGALGYPKCDCCGDISKCSIMLCQSIEASNLVPNNGFGEWIWQGLWLTLPMYPWFSEKTKQVYTRNIFEVMRDKNITFQDLKKMLNAYIYARNSIFGVRCSNNEYYLVRENKRFAFGIYSNEFNLWGDNSQFLGRFDIDINKIPSKEFIKWIENITKEYCENIIHCSDCGKAIKYTDIAGRYFAGIYCEDCWENNGWKIKELNETYD